MRQDDVHNLQAVAVNDYVTLYVRRFTTWTRSAHNEFNTRSLAVGISDF